jgi:hypothetical protein
MRRPNQAKTGNLTAIDCNALSPDQNARHRFVLERITNVKRETFR